MSDNIIKKIFNSSFSQQMNIDMDLLQAKYEMKFETLKIDASRYCFIGGHIRSRHKRNI